MDVYGCHSERRSLPSLSLKGLFPPFLAQAFLHPLIHDIDPSFGGVRSHQPAEPIAQHPKLEMWLLQT